MCVCTLCTLLIFIDPHFEMGKLMIDWNWGIGRVIFPFWGACVKINSRLTSTRELRGYP